MSERLKLAEYFVNNYQAAAVDELQQMPATAAGELIETLDDELSASVLHSMPPIAAARCIESVPRKSASRYLDAMNAKQAAAILRQTDLEIRKELLSLMSRQQSFRVSVLLRYQKSLVGASMDVITVSLRPQSTIGNAQQQVVAQNYAHTDIYLVNSQYHVQGTVSYFDLLGHEDTGRPVSDIAKPSARPIYASLTLKQAIEHKEWSEQETLPVIDRDGKLIGIIRFIDLWRIMVEHPPEAPQSRQSSEAFGIAELYCLGLADLVFAALSTKRNMS